MEKEKTPLPEGLDVIINIDSLLIKNIDDEVKEECQNTED